MMGKIMFGMFVLGMLIWLWPNLVHEPLHLAALKMQGADGTISFDWHFPSAPSTTRTTPVRGIVGGLFYVLLPSIVNVIILIGLWLTRKDAMMLTHISLAAYLGFDLIINMLRYSHVTSDFHFFVVFPAALPIFLSGVVGLCAVWIIAHGARSIEDVETVVSGLEGRQR